MIARCTWDAVTDADGYNVYLDSGAGFVKHNTSLITGTQYDIEGLEDGDYEAYVSAVEGTFESGPSNTDTFSISPTAGSIVMNGSDQYVSLTTLGTYGANQYNSRIDFWIKTNVGNTLMSPYEVYNDGTNTTNVCIVNLNSSSATAQGRITLRMRDNSGTQRTSSVNSDTGITDGAWHKITAQWEAGFGTIWVDGVKQSMTHVGSSPADNFSNFEYPLLMGAANIRGSIQRHLNGSMTLFALYNASYSDADIENNWNSLPDTNDANLVATWFYGEGSGTTSADQSGNGVTATLEPGAGSVDDMWSVDKPTLV